ncbi:MAG TPA: T9SS type A sorting domain-containing protein [Saprospiraceae bacterium]|nr:T9SS type A sorting domain-containing protein [Saprospiraceae bacterium]
MHNTTTRCFLLFFLSLWAAAAGAQVSKDATVPVVAEVDISRPGITLTWPNTLATTLRVSRRLKGQTGSWTSLLNVSNSSIKTLTDTTVLKGQTYEYRVERLSNLAAYGYVHVAVDAPAIDNRGQVLLFVEEALTKTIDPEISRLKADLRGDGWQVVEHIVPDTTTVAQVKSQILKDYAASPTQVKSVFLLGAIPIPYSGNTQWDGHPEHNGAWPADAYYAELNGLWTDATVNNAGTGRIANQNIPGDGKFDQSFLPSAAEIAVGRVDFRRIDPAAFGTADRTGLYRRYLDKDHDWRTGRYTTETRALVDDNFGYFNGEAFAANGFRNAYPLVGEANVVETDFFQNTNPQRWLLGYGTGPGSYTSASGVGNSSNFAADTVHIVFSNLFGSYHGDWDFETNPFMPSALASRGGILTCGWAGRPHHFYQGLASGESIGFCMRETLNAVYNPGLHATQAEGGAHIALLGDPTLRAHIVQPARNVRVAEKACKTLTLAWTAADDATVAGYHIYRAASLDGPYERLNSDAVTDTTFLDTAPLLGQAYYSVRSTKRQTSPGGGIYWNTGTGAPIAVEFEGGEVPQATATGATITCTQPMPTVEATSSVPNASFLWTGPGNFTSSLPNPAVQLPGTYAVLVTAAGNCSSTATAVVVSDTLTPDLSLPTELTYTCDVVCAILELPALPDIVYEMDLQPISDLSLEFCTAGQYTIRATNTRNGCSSDHAIEVVANLAEPGALAGYDGPGIINCQTVGVPLTGNSPTAGVIYQWTGPNGFVSTLRNPLVPFPGTYFLTVINPVNGCSSVDSVTVSGQVEAPIITLPPTYTLTCSTSSLQICAQVSPANSVIQWVGPGGLNSTQLCIVPTLPGKYMLTAINPVNGCTSTATVDVLFDIAIPDLHITGDNVLTCTLSSVTLCAESNTPGVVFAWSGPSQVLGKCIQVAFPGVYTCIATSPNGCTNSMQALVTQDVTPPHIIFTGLEPLDCNTPCITVQFSSITPGVMLDSLRICQPGAYTVEATNPANGCTSTLSFEVKKADTLLVDAPTIPTTLCAGQALNITLSPTGGTLPYRYVWSTGDTTATLALPANFSGPVAYTVSDGGGCEVTFGPVQVQAQPPIGIQITKTNESVGGAADGTALADASGPNGPYKYAWSNGKSEALITGLSAGHYTVTVTDALGCTGVATVEIKVSTALHEVSGELELSLSPNPADAEALLSLSMQEHRELSVRVLDALGRTVAEPWVGRMASGTLRLDVGGLPAGVYWVQVRAGERTGVRKLVVEH